MTTEGFGYFNQPFEIQPHVSWVKVGVSLMKVS
jgi:hypothetical protein